MTDLTHDVLVQLAIQWLKLPWRNPRWRDGEVGDHSACGVVVSELVTFSLETPDAIGWHQGISTVVECKTSRADFRADTKKSFRMCPELGMGVYRYFMTPKGLVTVDELPENWGLIEVNDNWKTRVVKASGHFEADARSENVLLVSLLRRLKGIEHDNHVGVKTYSPFPGNKKKATMSIESGDPQDSCGITEDK